MRCCEAAVLQELNCGSHTAAVGEEPGPAQSGGGTMTAVLKIDCGNETCQNHRTTFMNMEPGLKSPVLLLLLVLPLLLLLLLLLQQLVLVRVLRTPGYLLCELSELTQHVHSDVRASRFTKPSRSRSHPRLAAPQTLGGAEWSGEN